MNYSRSVLISFLALNVTACTKVDFHDLDYPPEFNLNMRPGGAVTQFAVSGIRGYTDDPDDGTCKGHAFHMDEGRDKFTFIIFDNDGVLPGSSFAYNIQLINPNNLAVLWTQTLTTDVPTSYGQRVKRFKFIYSLAPSKAPVFNNDEMTVELQYSPVAANNPSGFVGGAYQITTTQALGRYITFDMKFDMADVVQYIDACALGEVPPPP